MSHLVFFFLIVLITSLITGMITFQVINSGQGFLIALVLLLLSLRFLGGDDYDNYDPV